MYLDPIEDIPELRARLWEHLAFALFSSHTRAWSSIVGVDDIAAVLASQDPISHLFNRESLGSGDESSTGSVRDRSVTTGMLKRGTSVTLLPSAREAADASATWKLATDVCGVKWLESENNSKLAHVLLPGYGACRVQRDQVIQTMTLDKRAG